MRTITLTAHITFKMQPATGPNPENLDYELIDGDGDRLAYVCNAVQAADEIKDLLDPSGSFGSSLDVSWPR